MKTFKEIEEKIIGKERNLYKVSIGDLDYYFSPPTYLSILMSSKESQSIDDETISGFYSMLATMCYSLKKIGDTDVEEMIKSDPEINTIEKVGKWMLNVVIPRVSTDDIPNLVNNYANFISKNSITFEKIMIENAVNVEKVATKKEEKNG